jgi:hypothetical protein
MESIHEYLAERKSEFYGLDWRPRNLFLSGQVQEIYSDAYQFYLDLVDLPLHEEVGGAQLVEWRKQIRWALESARKNRQMDHQSFIGAIARVYEFGNRIFRRLRKSELSR